MHIRPKIADFGISRRIQPNQPMQTQSFTCTYASPEQLSSQTYTASTDVWSFGVTLYELLTSRHPFGLTGTTPLKQLVELVEHAQPRFPIPGVPLPVSDIIKRMLSKNPQDRPTFRQIEEVFQANLPTTDPQPLPCPHPPPQPPPIPPPPHRYPDLIPSTPPSTISSIEYTPVHPEHRDVSLIGSWDHFQSAFPLYYDASLQKYTRLPFTIPGVNPNTLYLFYFRMYNSFTRSYFTTVSSSYPQVFSAEANQLCNFGTFVGHSQRDQSEAERRKREHDAQIVEAEKRQKMQSFDVIYPYTAENTIDKVDLHLSTDNFVRGIPMRNNHEQQRFEYTLDASSLSQHSSAFYFYFTVQRTTNGISPLYPLNHTGDRNRVLLCREELHRRNPTYSAYLTAIHYPKSADVIRVQVTGLYDDATYIDVPFNSTLQQYVLSLSQFTTPHLAPRAYTLLFRVTRMEQKSLLSSFQTVDLPSVGKVNTLPVRLNPPLPLPPAPHLPPSSPTSLFLGSLPGGITERELQPYFRIYPVLGIKVPRTQHYRMSWYAFVDCESAEICQRYLNYYTADNPLIIQGHKVQIQLSDHPPPSTTQSRPHHHPHPA